ncbi:kinase-like domain-containing protein [Gymnopilus junonius]|uniref:Kinase-like domain-containing protein n=1 Tax=Gymnopilus junonius TaxID=109634 RepID=A0A9P5NYD2_GYMJU|nr:kinase-like domain-containing protein [Gymnopilus junonius]
MSAYTVPLDPQSSAQTIFDPQGEVLTTKHFDAYYDESSRPMINNYVRHVKVGGGQHGDVYLCYQINTRLPSGHPQRRIPVAMKSVKRNNPRAEQYRVMRQRNQQLPQSEHTPMVDRLNTTEAKIKREIAIMKKLRHPHVVRLYEVIDDRVIEKIYMVMEYLGGGEVKWRDDNNRPVLTVAQTRRILRDAVLGLEYLHYQGIIHRDIKPANLLWTEDRRQVKIGDFGVSHFSYAQRLAAAGGQDEDDDPYDPILLDESGLTRRAGTPAFFAPEVIFEHTHGVAGSISLNSSALQSSSSLLPSSTSASPPGTERPPINKAIDIWALGVTLYCLLFGTTPFVAVQSASSHGSEYSLYNSICNDDWPAPSTMGYDRLPTGGRHPHPDSEGASIIHLLDHFLQKDQRLRITLDDVKKQPWILKGLAEPRNWLQITSPTATKIDVSVNETSDAMSVVLFRWRWGGKLARHVSSLFRRPGGPRLSEQPPPEDDSGAFPDAVVSDPQGQWNRFTTAQGPSGVGSSPTIGLTKRDKGKAKAEAPRTLKRPSSKGSKSLRAKSIDREQGALQGSALKARRGSESKIVDRSTSGTSSPPAKQGEKKTRFAGFFQISNWRPTKFSSAQAPSSSQYAQSHTTGTMGGIGVGMLGGAPGASSQTPNTRRSEEALRYYRLPADANESGNLTAARRASSWGQGDDKEFTEIVSVQSVGQELNEHTMNVGAGGVSRDRIMVPVAGPSTLAKTNEPALSPVPIEQHFDDEFEQYGHPVYDGSSTIGSVVDNDSASWQRGSELEEAVEYDYSSEEEENGVMFSPRRHANSDDPELEYMPEEH